MIEEDYKHWQGGQIRRELPPAASPAGGAQHDIQRGQYVWVEGVVVGGDQPRDFPKRARIHVYGIGTGIPKEFKPVTEASQPSPAAAGERALREALERLVNAVRTLGKISKRDGRTLFESPPSKDKDSLNAWLELNEAQKVARETLASQPAQPEQP